MNHIPILRAVIRRTLELTRHVSAQPIIQEWRPRAHFPSTPVEDTYNMLYVLYDLDKSQIDSIEEYIDSEFTTLPFDANHPLLQKIVEYDVPAEDKPCEAMVETTGPHSTWFAGSPQLLDAPTLVANAIVVAKRFWSQHVLININYLPEYRTTLRTWLLALLDALSPVTPWINCLLSHSSWTLAQSLVIAPVVEEWLKHLPNGKTWCNIIIAIEALSMLVVSSSTRDWTYFVNYLIRGPLIHHMLRALPFKFACAAHFMLNLHTLSVVPAIFG